LAGGASFALVDGLIDGVLVAEEMRTVEANATEDLADVVEHIAVVDGLLEGDVAEMTGAGGLIALAGLAKSVIIHSSHPVIVDPTGDGVTVLFVDLLLVNLAD